MRRLVLVFAVFLAVPPAGADALTVRDIVELSRAGLGEEVLLALIEVDPSVFPIDTATLKLLKDAGVTQRVIVAMVRSARTPPPPIVPDPYVGQVAPPAPEPQVVVIDHHDTEPRVREVQVAVPIFIPVVQHSRMTRRHFDRFDRAPDFEDHRSRTDQSTRSDHPSKPVYWGTAGTLRPDAWKPK